jgi:uncharacterized coiled-coil DUF342 family protein
MGDYIAKFSATYTDDTAAVGDYNFGVVDKGFFKHKSTGGLVQKVISTSVWTDNEKNKVIKTIDEIESKLSEIDKMVNNNINKQIIGISSNIADSINKISAEIKSIKDDIKVNKYAKSFEEIGLKFDNLKYEFATVNANINQPDKDLLSKINELKAELTEISEAMIKIMPTESIEEVLNESEKVSGK